jgi:hypothetical protein
MPRAFTASFLLLLAITVAHAQPAKPQRVLFIGNSLTYTNDIPARVAKLARAMGKDVVVESVAFPSFSLEDHWTDGRAAAAIAKGWDVVVLQQGTSAQADSREQLVDYSKRFAAKIRAAGARPALYMVWPLLDRQRDFPAAIESYRAAANAVDGILIPAGEAWLRVMSADKRIRLYGDTIHPSSLGSDLCVLTIYLSLFPAGPTEFDEAYVGKIARVLEIDKSRRDLFFDAATRSIDEPLAVK